MQSQLVHPEALNPQPNQEQVLRVGIRLGIQAGRVRLLKFLTIDDPHSAVYPSVEETYMNFVSTNSPVIYPAQ